MVAVSLALGLRTGLAREAGTPPLFFFFSCGFFTRLGRFGSLLSLFTLTLDQYLPLPSWR
jgi:hypothetical protein